MSKFGTSTRITSVVLSYGLAVLSVAAAFSITQLLRTYFEPTPNSLFFFAIVVSSWFGGLGPGLLSGVLSVGVIHYYFIYPRYIFWVNPEDVPRLAVFLISAAAISWLSAGQKRAKESLRQARDELEYESTRAHCRASARQRGATGGDRRTKRSRGRAPVKRSPAQAGPSDRPSWVATKSMCSQATLVGPMKYSAC